MYSKIYKLGLVMASFTLLTLLSTGSVNAQSRCPATIYADLNNTITQEYAVNDDCRDLYISINTYQSHVNTIRFDAHDFGSNYKMDIFYKGQNGVYYLAQSNIDIETRDDQNNCGERNNEPDYGENRCFVAHTHDINQNASGMILRIYTEAGKTIRSNEYAYIRNIRIEGYSNYYPYPTATPTQWPTWSPTPVPTYYWGRPNLMVEDIEVNPQNPDYYEDVDIKVTIRNKNGNADAQGFFVRMYRNNVEIANTYYSDTLYSGASLTWKVNNNYLDTGNNAIRVIVDPDNRIYETSENDNDRTENVYKSYQPYQSDYPYYTYPDSVLGDSTNIYINGNCNNVVMLSDIGNNRYYAPIYAASCYGITNGYNDNTYRPDSYITRAEYISMLARSFPEVFNNYSNCGYFRDVEQGNVHGYNIQRAKCAGILRGYSDNTFRPGNYISYGEAATVLYNLLGKYNYNYTDLAMNYQPYFMNQNSPHYYSVYYLSNMNPYSYYPAYDYHYSYSQQDSNYATRGWIANSIMNTRSYTY